LTTERGISGIRPLEALAAKTYPLVIWLLVVGWSEGETSSYFDIFIDRFGNRNRSTPYVLL
jgi:hypothetical protein